ncbi:GPP34 family phosphoprotein [Verrucosispora sp. WMMD1129]|uniref:GOLPH3/VPS74 family protein n=1 Tax=Verrucosispora sp. WMMD1129 TaxID=3016093 RepID=UPI00249CC6F9|nr:GPP34 family phosphoprotein [Verrucosispora sp. WMMD1129]WFE45269.1 GPP34 family phosphoprotein [Verrucosispora sp. WMMD1129]
MTRQPDNSSGTPAETAPTLVEDLLLLLFQPRSGTIAGENILFYVLAGAVLADLALADRVTMADRRKVKIVEGQAPSDDLLRSAWDYLSEKPRGVQTVLAAIGPELRKPVLERLVERGDITREDRKMLGLFRTTALRDGGTGRRARLLEEVRQVLVDGAEPSARVAALAALLSGSGTLPQFYRDIPWTTPVIKRAKELEQGNWGAGAAAEAVTRTMTATVVNSVIVTTTVIPRS